MSIRGLLSATKGNFGGSWTAVDAASIDDRGASFAQNVRYFKNEVQTRYGWGVAASFSSYPAGTSGMGPGPMYNWISSLGDYLVWSNSGGSNTINLSRLTDNPPTIVANLSVSANFGIPVFAPIGPRLFVSNWTIGNAQTQFTSVGPAVISYNGVFNYDPIIPGPASTTLVPSTAPTEPGVGVVTAGLHYIGLRMLHRSGFLGRPGPDTSTTTNPTPQTFAPIAFTSTGNHNLKWAFTPGTNWPADVIQVQLLMSPVDNPNQFFLIPGATQNVTGGSATSVNITFNIADDALVAGAAAIDCTNSLNFYTASATGQAYMQCLAVAAIGSRMFYISQLPDANGNMFSVIFASDSANYQQISLSQHVIQIPNQLDIRAVFGVQGAIYIVGPHWTYVTQDTGGVPVTWPTPQIVDGRKGAEGPNCVEVATSGQYAWVADRSGLYYFNGIYQALPIDYLGLDYSSFLKIPDVFLQVVDDPLRHRVLVNGSQIDFGSKYFILEFDYTFGLDPYSVRYTRHDRLGMFAGPIAIVQNDLTTIGVTSHTKVPELWLGATGLGSDGKLHVYREKNPVYDSNVYQDDAVAGAAAIHTIYETNAMPEPGGSALILAHQAVIPRIVGSGTMSAWGVYTLDKQQFKNLPSYTLSLTPDFRPIQRCYLKGSGFIYHFEMNAVGSFFILSDLTLFYSKFAGHR